MTILAAGNRRLNGLLAALADYPGDLFIGVCLAGAAPIGGYQQMMYFVVGGISGRRLVVVNEITIKVYVIFVDASGVGETIRV
jgi:hypothetical protein